MEEEIDLLKAQVSFADEKLASLHNFIKSERPSKTSEVEVLTSTKVTPELEQQVISTLLNRLHTPCSLNEVSSHVSNYLETEHGGIWLTVIKPADVEIGMVTKSSKSIFLLF